MIYDCFTFFNELDFLEVRLNILDGIVDKFVLVEATKNHQGKSKPLFFNENKQRFSKFLDKIIHVVVNEYPPNPDNNAWVLEHHQRNCIAKGLKECKPDDVILVSDVDEIPRPESIRQYQNTPGVKIFCQSMYYYYINCVNATDMGEGRTYGWMGSVMFPYSSIKTNIQEFRDMSIRMRAWNHLNTMLRIYWRVRLRFDLKKKQLKLIPEGGWHFSFLGGVECIIQKLEAFAHTEYSTAEYKDPGKIHAAISGGADIFGRSFRYRFVPLDETYPSWLVENIDKYPQFVKR